jgi:hypothetical protein
MKKELLLKIMDEKIKLGWDFERTFQYLCEVDENENNQEVKKMSEENEDEKYISAELELGDLVVIDSNLDYLSDCIYEKAVFEIVKIEDDIIVIKNNNGCYRRIWKIH